jgi:hypothetical protein
MPSCVQTVLSTSKQTASALFQISNAAVLDMEERGILCAVELRRPYTRTKNYHSHSWESEESASFTLEVLDDILMKDCNIFLHLK